MKHLNKGILISIEGIDGSGKTTLAKELHKFLLKNNFSAIITKEPSETIIGEQVRSFLKKNIRVCDLSEYLFFAADRAQHFHEIVIPSIKEKKIVISDRLSDSSLAYQGFGKNLDLNIIYQINSWAMCNIKPDIIFYLKVDPKIALQRVNKRNETISQFENLLLLEKISNGFDKIFKDKNDVIILDASLPFDQLSKLATEQLELSFKQYYE